VNDGTRTRDIRDHNAALYQLSYIHRVAECLPDGAGCGEHVKCTGRQPAASSGGSAGPSSFSAPPCSLASSRASSEEGPGGGAKIAAR
jgi:hypothetical protein